MAKSVKFTIRLDETTSDDKLQKLVNKAVDEKIQGVVKKVVEVSGGGGGGRAPRRGVNLDQHVKLFEEVQSQTGRQAVPTLEDQVQRGGIYGYEVAPPVKGFESRQAVRGGVQEKRDNRSAQPHVQERWIHMIKRLEDDIANTKLQLSLFEDLIDDGTQLLESGAAILSNPQGFVGQQMLGLLGKAGPYGAAIAAAIIGIVAAPEAVKQIIKLLATKGGPLNRDFRRSIEDEVNAFFDIQQKKRRLLGIDGFIVTQTDRYQPDDGTVTYNSFVNRDEVRIAKVGQYAKSVGVI